MQRMQQRHHKGRSRVLHLREKGAWGEGTFDPTQQEGAEASSAIDADQQPAVYGLAGAHASFVSFHP